jgi:hypothetical protein
MEGEAIMLDVRKSTVDSRINYYAPTVERPQIFAGDYSRNEVSYDPRVMPIADGSALQGETDLDREGFRLVRHRSAVTDFDDVAQYEQVYKPEIAALLLTVTGADHVALIGSGAVRRSAGPRGPDGDDTTTPVHFPHVDASDIGIQGLLDLCLPDRPTGVKRWAFYNSWRQLSIPPVDEPLAICDARSVAPDDLVPYDSYFPDGMAIESLMLRHNPDHRWTFFSRMGRDDLLIFKTNDSDGTKARFVPHSAFSDDRFADRAIRASVELRAYACWF